jgi:hypothetical protein
MSDGFARRRTGEAIPGAEEGSGQTPDIISDMAGRSSLFPVPVAARPS